MDRRERVPLLHERSCHFTLGGGSREPLNLVSVLSCTGRGASEHTQGKRNAEKQLASVHI